MDCLPPGYGARVGKAGKSEKEQTDAIERLSRVFGIDHVPEHEFIKAPPQFMLELFKDITDVGGLIRKKGPYNASTVVSFPDKGKFIGEITYLRDVLLCSSVLHYADSHK